MQSEKDIQFIGVVLSGGRSSRMGSNKAFLVYQGRRLVDRMVSLLEEIKTPLPVQRVLVSGVVDDCSCVPDLIPDQGPLGGIYSVLVNVRSLEKHCKAVPYLLIVPVDMPGLTPELLSFLLDRADGNAQLIHFADYELPLVLRASLKLEEVLYQVISESKESCERSIRGFIDKLARDNPQAVVSLPAPSHAEFLNVNSPDDWRSFVEDMQ